MSANEYVPSEANVRVAYILAGIPDNASPDSIERAGRRAGPEFDRFLAKVKRDAFEKGIATGYMRGYHDSEVGLLYSPPIPPTTPEEAR